MEKEELSNTKLSCKFPQCTRKILAKGWCSAHYQQVVVYGKDPKPIIEPMTLIERLMSKIIKTETCWLWTGLLNNTGYGRLNSKLYAHRVIFEIYNNIKLTKNQEVCHKCDNPRCVRPDHLFLSEHSGNMLDMAVKGRSGNKKLSDEQVIEIRRLKPLMSYKQLSEMFCVSKSSIKDIISGRNYAWLK
jgi:hypothetical protein